MNRSSFASVALIVLLVACTPAVGFAQEDAPAPRPRNEFGIRQVSFGAGYDSQTIPDTVSNFRDPTFLGNAFSLNVATEIRWLHPGDVSFFEIRYAPQLAVQSHDQTLRDFNQMVTASVHLNPKRSRWHVAGASTAQIQTADEALYPSSPISAVATDASFRELAEANLGATSSSPEEDVLRGGLTPDLNQLRVLFGRKSASYGGSGTISYSSSARLMASVTAGAGHIQHLNDPSDLIGFSYPDSTSKSVSANISYELSRRTAMTVSGSVSQVNSTVADQTGQSGRLSINHTMRQRVFFQLGGGIGTTNIEGVKQSTAVYLVGVGVKLASHSFMVSNSRDVADAYTIAAGPGASSFTASTGAWYWAPRRSTWTASVSFDHFIDAPPDQPATHTWNVRTNVSRSFTQKFAVLLQGAVGEMGSRRYIQDGQQYQMGKMGLRLSLVWTPAKRRVR